MTEDRIETLCQRLYEAVIAEKAQETLAVGLELLSGFLIATHRIADALTRLAEHAPREAQP